MPNLNLIVKHWDACLYEQQETQREDVDFLLSLLGPAPQRVLEAACGTGRMTLPMAEAGHLVDGFDVNPFMLERLQKKLAGGAYPGVTARRMDGCQGDWGAGYDAVVLGANLLLNLVTQEDYAQTQRLFLKRAASALRPGGHLFLDFDCRRAVGSPQPLDEGWVCFEGTDDWGTFGRYIVMGDEETGRPRLLRCHRRYELAPREGEPFTTPLAVFKYFPLWDEARDWLEEAGLRVDQLFSDYRPASHVEPGCRATVWAVKD